jgi:translocation protein SEC62
MSDNKRLKKKQELNDKKNEQLSKEENKILRFMRLSCPSRQCNIMGMKVNYFIGNKLIDNLMDSKWGPGTPEKPNKNAYFNSRHGCVTFMNKLMAREQYFYRAIKIYKESNEETPKTTVRRRKINNNTDQENTPSNKSPTPSSPDSKSNSKRKFKLEVHEIQKFYDANEPFVWVYDPTSIKTYIIGSLLILAVIGICLFPLWPNYVREGIYYVSVAGASFLGAILALSVLKYIFFAAVWMFTFGNIHFWLFPNLTEDVGFFESFKPVYKLSTSATRLNDKIEKEKKKSLKSQVDNEKDQTNNVISSSTVNTPKVNADDKDDERRPSFTAYDLSASTIGINRKTGDGPLDNDDFEIINEDDNDDDGEDDGEEEDNEDGEDDIDQEDDQ